MREHVVQLRPKDNKAIDASAPLATSAAGLAGDGIEADEVTDAEAITFRGTDQVVKIAGCARSCSLCRRRGYAEL